MFTTINDDFNDFIYEPPPYLEALLQNGLSESIWCPIYTTVIETNKHPDIEINDTTETSPRKCSDEEDDLNKKVDIIIANSRTFKKRKRIGKRSIEPMIRSRKPKIRKSNDQIELLKLHFKQNWSKQEITDLSKLTEN